MTRYFLSAALIMAVPAYPALAEEPASKASGDAVKGGKIKDKKHPDYVRCRSERVVGSLAKRRKVCLTNREWAEVSRDGNAVARKTVEDMQSGLSGG